MCMYEEAQSHQNKQIVALSQEKEGLAATVSALSNQFEEMEKTVSCP